MAEALERCGARLVRERENDVSGFAYSEPVMEKLLVGTPSLNTTELLICQAAKMTCFGVFVHVPPAHKLGGAVPDQPFQRTLRHCQGQTPNERRQRICRRGHVIINRAIACPESHRQIISNHLPSTMSNMHSRDYITYSLIIKFNESK